MNYINNSTALCCFSLDKHDTFSVTKRIVLQDTESGEILSFSETPRLGRTYVCTEVWALDKGYSVLEYYSCEDLPRDAYNHLMKQLGLTGIVINLGEG